MYIVGKHDHSYGYWSAGQPQGDDESCTYVSIDEKQYYKYAWSLDSCQEALSYVCRAPACLQGQCNTGRSRGASTLSFLDLWNLSFKFAPLCTAEKKILTLSLSATVQQCSQSNVAHPSSPM
jgi:hypothetical protein